MRPYLDFPHPLFATNSQLALGRIGNTRRWWPLLRIVIRVQCTIGRKECARSARTNDSCVLYIVHDTIDYLEHWGKWGSRRSYCSRCVKPAISYCEIGGGRRWFWRSGRKGSCNVLRWLSLKKLEAAVGRYRWLSRMSLRLWRNLWRMVSVRISWGLRDVEINVLGWFTGKG